MYQIHGINISSNTVKTVYVAEALGIEYDYIAPDISKGEHKTPAYLELHPLGKLPILKHDDKTLYESNVICTYLAEVEKSPLYPADDIFYRAKIDQWISFFSNHPGRWLNTYFFQTVAKAKLGLGDPDEGIVKEAVGYLAEQLPMVNTQLENSTYLAGSEPSIADFVAFAYVEKHTKANFSLSDYPAILRWYETIDASDAIASGRSKLS